MVQLASGFEEAAVASPKLVHSSLGEWAIHRLNAHQLAFLGIKVSLERPTIFGRDQQ